MNFEPWGHIVQNAKPEKKQSDLLKKTSELPQKQPAKEKSPDTQWIVSNLRAVKMEGYDEVQAGQAPTRSRQTPV